MDGGNLRDQPESVAGSNNSELMEVPCQGFETLTVDGLS
jgi:hypothetical protein